MWKEKILLVDDEPRVLDGYRRQLRNHYNFETAVGGREALEKIESNGPFAVVVADMRMPGMDGVEFLKAVRKQSPETVRMMLTGNADQQTAVMAVNEGNIFRFMTKPCPAGQLITTLASGIRQYRLITSEKELLEHTLQGCIKMLTEILSLTDSEAFDHATKVRNYVQQIAPALKTKTTWELEAAATLMPIGFVILPPELKTKVLENKPLSQAESEMLSEVPEIGYRLLSHIPRLEAVAEYVRTTLTKFSKSGADANAPIPDDISFEANMLSVISALVELESTGRPIAEVLDIMSKGQYNQQILSAAQDVLLNNQELRGGKAALLDARIKDIAIGDILRSNVDTEDDRRLLTAGTRITVAFLERINRYHRLIGIKEPIRVVRWTAE
ncbi:MAG: response regulator [Myxococcota bacterium]|nr:response regulator [Myxococcota bacterium]